MRVLIVDDHAVLRDVSIVENPILTRSGAERLIEWRNTVTEIRLSRRYERWKSACGLRFTAPTSGSGTWITRQAYSDGRKPSKRTTA